jgi:PKD repeat protein
MLAPVGPRVLSRALSATLSAALAVALLFTLLAPGARAAGAGQYGQVQRFGGFDVADYKSGTPTAGKFLDPRGFAVDTQDSEGGPQDTAVYVLDRTTPSDGQEPSTWRIQKLSETGAVLASTTFTFPNKSPGGKATAVQDLAVDPAAGRLYALVVGQPPVGKQAEPVAQELIAWSTTPNGSKQLVAPSGLTSDPLGTGAGLVSSQSQLEEGTTPLYEPQGIAVDPTGASTSPVAIEATDLDGAADVGGVPPGNTIVQQVSTETGGNLGDLLGKWSSESVAAQLGGKSWGPGGISLSPAGDLIAMLNNDPENLTYAVSLSGPSLGTATVLDSSASLPASADFDELPFAGASAPFGDALTGQAISEAQDAGPELVQLSTPTSSTTGGLFAGLFKAPRGEDPQTGGGFYFYEGINEIETPGSGELYFQANLGVRLLQQGEHSQISTPNGGTIVNTLANPEQNAACDFGSATNLAFAAGNDGALWVLVEGPQAGALNGLITAEETATGDQVVELEPGGAGTPCPQPSGTFAMQAAGGSWQEGDSELTIAAGTTVKFDAAKPEAKGGPPGLDTQGGSPFAYEWELNGNEPKNGKPVNEMVGPAFSAPPPTAEYTYTTTGVYKVKLTFRSDYGAYTTQEGTVHVLGELVPPTAQFDVTTSAPQVNETVEFNASGSQGGSGKITGYEWNWGDGSPSESISGRATAAHKYTKAGPYTVTLIVTNNLGQKSVVAASQEVVVKEAPIIPPPPTTTTTTNPPPPPPPPDRSATNVSPHGSESKTTGTVALTLSCPATKVSCAGTVTIETANAVAAKAKKAKRKRVVLGQGSFSLSGGQSETVTLHLSSAGAKLLSKLKRIPVVITVSAHDSFGDPGTQSLSLTLTTPVSSRHKKHR